MIEFQANPVATIPSTDWVFFTSKNSVRYFFEQGLTIDQRKIACVGRGTKNELIRFVPHIDFIGDDVNIETVAQQFVELIRTNTCLFPISNISKRTIQKAFKTENQAFDLVVYSTKEKEQFQKPVCDILVFTSPSNVRAYFKKFKCEEQQCIIAMGKSTGNQLKELGVENFSIPKSTGEMGIIDLILSAD